MPSPTQTQAMIVASLALLKVIPGPSGKIFYVDSTHAKKSDTVGSGRSPNQPFATLDYAIGRCQGTNGDTSVSTAAKGDVIIVAPGHAENISAAGFVTMDVAGVTVVGLGNGRNRPTFTWTATAGTILMSGANTRISNCVFLMYGVDGIVSGISVTGADVRIDNCEFELSNPAGTAFSAILGILSAATATRLQIDNNFFHCPITITTNTPAAAIKHEVGVDFRIEKNIIQGKMATAILNATTILRGTIADNKIHVYTGTEGITLATATQCHVINNDIIVASGTAPVIGAAASFTGNRYSTEGNGPTAGTAATF